MIKLVKNEGGYEFPEYQGQLLPWSISLTLADELEGFPRARTVIQAMRQYRPEQLERERLEMLKGSCDRMFGHNAKKALALIEQESAVALAKEAESALKQMRERLVICDEVQTPHSYAVCSCTWGHKNPRLVVSESTTNGCSGATHEKTRQSSIERESIRKNAG